MARLTTAEALERIKNPVNQNKITKAREQEERLIFHCEPVSEFDQMPASARDRFLSFVDSLLPRDKSKRFRQLLTTPVDTVISTKAIFDELSRFLDAEDRYIKFDFVSDTISADFDEYHERTGDLTFWKTKGLDALKTGINSVLVVDLATEQSTTRPEPYYYLVSIFNIRDVDFNLESGICEYLIFDRNKDKATVVIDDEFYRVFVKDEKTGEFLQTIEAAHSRYTEGGQLVDGLGYCPARSFFNVPIYGTDGICKRGPLTDVLGKLDWLLFWRTCKKYVDIYAAFPIVGSYKTECNYRDKEQNRCNEGFVNYREIDPSTDRFIDLQKRCPVCAAKEIVGPGSYIEVDAPKDKDEFDMLSNLVRFYEGSNDKLEYCVKEIQRLEDEIYLDCVGFDGDAIQNKAVNETQVGANFESKESVLAGIKTPIEMSHLFVMQTACRLRYDEYYLRGVVDYGTQYFLKTADELLNEYGLAKKSGMPGYYVAALRQQISRTRFKNNEEQRRRDFILEQLEPYPDLSVAEIQSLQLATTDAFNILIKLNFNTFVQRFEREQMDIIQFGSLISFDKKISLINSKFNDYVRELQGQQASIARIDTGENAGT